MQLYFYDTDQTMAHRIKRSPHLDSNLIKYILRILDGNPYVRVFIRLGQMQRLDEFKIELNTSISVDQRRYIAPAIEQVAAIWEDGTDEKQKFTRSIMVYPNSGHPHFIRAYYGCYDPLAYPVFYLGGETGWEVLAFLTLNRIWIPQAHRITAVALHLGVFQGIVYFLREALWLKSIEESNDKLY